MQGHFKHVTWGWSCHDSWWAVTGPNIVIIKWMQLICLLFLHKSPYKVNGADSCWSPWDDSSGMQLTPGSSFKLTPGGDSGLSMCPLLLHASPSKVSEADSCWSTWDDSQFLSADSCLQAGVWNNKESAQGKNNGSFLELILCCFLELTPSHFFELIPLELTPLELTPDDLRLVLVF